ncbi:MAG TPA: A24 family peptidase C-terminal domain-containing protein [Sulfolobales archaeon]|nr:A24 family peptidase C-terminal domain-containing protein [Sulfolobales archaeon]
MHIEPYFMAGYIIALVMLVITSYMDLKTREIDPRVWIPFVIAAIVMLIARFSIHWDSISVIYLLLSMIPPSILFALGFLGMMGLADPIALAIVSLLIPEPPAGLLLPPSMVVLIIASIFMLILLVIPMLIINLPRLGLISRHCGSKYLTTIIALTGFPISIRGFLGSKFLYPLIYPSLNEGKIQWICRWSFEIEEDPKAHREAIAMLLEKGYVSEREAIYVTWGVPYLVFLLLGVLLYPLAAGWVEELIRSLSTLFQGFGLNSG